MQEIWKLAEEVVKDGFVMNLGTIDEDGPWVASLVYVSDDKLNLYWISVPSSRHSMAIEKNPRVACTIVADHGTDKERALQIEGIAIALKDSSLEREQGLQEKRGVSLPAKEGEILKNGYQWYRLKPVKIELIHNELFGYDRKSVL
jgi:uncharacterized protein